MKIFEKQIRMDPGVQKNCRQVLPYPSGHICFFDIETTGLSPQVSSLYLIGASCFTGGGLSLTQWFADDYVSEEEILRSFARFTEDFSVFIHYNGSTFDIPYLEKKYQAHGLTSPFSGKENLDLYRLARKRKNWFATTDMKLTTMERFLGFQRNDRFTGKDCIRLYTEFMQKKYFRDSLSEKRRDQLLLHNHDDLLGTVLCSQLLFYTSYTPVHPVCEITATPEDGPDTGALCTDTPCLVLSDTVNGSFPVPVCTRQDDILYSFHSHQLRITIPLYEGTLYHFYRDYKNYYYLPEEDSAVHKSVGIYVDPAHRQKATAANCYTKKTGQFLPLPQKLIPEESVPLFRQERRGGQAFLWIDEKQPALSEAFLCRLLGYLLG